MLLVTYLITRGHPPVFAAVVAGLLGDPGGFPDV